MSTSNKNKILSIILLSQFCCTSLWFAGNGVMEVIIENFNLKKSALGFLTSAVQLGFISGTFLFAFYTISDRFSPSKVFFYSALASAVFNILIVLQFNTLPTLLVFRFLTGFFLAGIYPVGMKIAADYFEKGLGKSLGLLVGALVLGTALPHLLKSINAFPSWEFVIYVTSGLSTLGGVFIYSFVPNGPYRKPALKFDFAVIYNVFKHSNFRIAAFGYFGHMWELYGFWTFLPVVLKAYKGFHKDLNFDISLISFLVISVGALGCVLSGYLSQKFTVKKVAISALLVSGLCCILSPLFFVIELHVISFTFLLIWGMAVIADSPLFSTLVAQNAQAEVKGTALTIVNSIGFAVTILSIQLLNSFESKIDLKFLYLVLAIGPVFGLIHLLKKNS